jgi:hypothetical protein
VSACGQCFAESDGRSGAVFEMLSGTTIEERTGGKDCRRYNSSSMFNSGIFA